MFPSCLFLSCRVRQFSYLEGEDEDLLGQFWPKEALGQRFSLTNTQIQGTAKGCAFEDLDQCLWIQTEVSQVAQFVRVLVSDPRDACWLPIGKLSQGNTWAFGDHALFTRNGITMRVHRGMAQ